jgi:hypothetical protein
MKSIFTSLFTLVFAVSFSQQGAFPVFPGCEELQEKALEQCFYEKVHQHFKTTLTTQESAKGALIVLFEVNASGDFMTLYVDAPDQNIAAEARRVMALLPRIKPPMYLGQPTYAKYTIRLDLPVGAYKDLYKDTNLGAQGNLSQHVQQKEIRREQTYRAHPELDSMKFLDYSYPEFSSQLNIPFSHSFYAQFDDEMNQIGTNSHTSSKPFTYNEVSRYYDLKSSFLAVQKPRENWLGRKIWNENFVQIQGEDYWFALNPIFDLQVGKNTPGEIKSTYINTRGLQFRGGLGKNVHFTTTIFESQGRFADYFMNYAYSIAPSGGGPAIVPGIGIAKEFKADGLDFPMAEATLSITPSRFFDLQLGYGRNFIGDGYRSLLQSDGASPYPFVKLNTTFWKLKYTNTYMWLKDVRPEVTDQRTYETKYMASHYLSWNLNQRLNLGFFESVVWANTNGRGFDANFVNPIIFYRAVEFSSSARSGNALLGLTGKYKASNRINLYGQFLVDEFSLNDVKAANQSWKNKFGYQIGAKYYHALNVQNLLLQAEYNHVRPYVYAHSDPLTNYAHNNQSLGHQWGGNFKEAIVVARYHRGRIFADAKITIGERGLDFDTEQDNFNYGGNIFKDYEIGRPFDTGVTVGQGNKTEVFIADFQAGYLVNPATNLKLFGSVIYRNFDPSQVTASAFKNSTTWFSVGLRCDIFNWYFDY